MHSTITEATPAPAVSFPCLMQSKRSRLVVLFTSVDAGVVVHAVGLYSNGRYEEDLPPLNEGAEWQPFTGTVHLSNTPPEPPAH